MASHLVRTGIDAIEISRIRDVLSRHGARFLRRVYTDAEQSKANGRAEEFAARFAAKEAVSKALGTGMRSILWKDIEILNDHRGKPLVHLHGNAQQRAQDLGITDLDVSLTHSRELAIAVAVALMDV